MKASILEKSWIMIQSALITLKTSIVGLSLRYGGRYSRGKANSELRWWAQALLDCIGATYEISDPFVTRIEPGRPYIIMSNHRCLYDIPLIYMSLPGTIRMLTKKELFRVPVWGQALKAAEFLSIDRQNHEQALKDMDYAKIIMKTGLVPWIAPEGTRSRHGTKMGPFKKGGFMLAIQTKATIIPVGIDGSEKILPANTFDFYPEKHVKIRIGKGIDASGYKIEDRDALMEEVRSSIAELSKSE
ncbi:MAG: lysophospholipid acyltransferase family protein [Thermodesulfobacteriota bacterium]|nr:lysophospholipid acyltransferase family protein [Thermodesulfobacteriota bacterium]